MKSLEKNFNYKGFTYQQEWRNEDFAVYSQWLKAELIAYESFKIRKNKSYERFGNFYEAAESFPSDNQWGQLGFTSKSFNGAQEILLKHFSKIQNLTLEKRTEPRTQLKGYRNTPEIKINPEAIIYEAESEIFDDKFRWGV